MQAVASVCTTGYDLAQEDDFSSLFCDGYVHAAYARQQLRYLDQFVIMRSEEGACATAFIVVQVFDDGTRNGKTIVGAGTPSNLVEDDQAAGRSVMQDVGRLDHLNHKGALSCGRTFWAPMRVKIRFSSP